MHHCEALALALIVLAGGNGCTPSTPSALQPGPSGIKGTTRVEVVSGVPGGPTIGGPASLEFAVAPVLIDKPVYDRAIFAKSDAQGAFQLELSPGTYWIGPKGKALDSANFDPGSVVFSEKTVVVKEGNFTPVELLQTGYAP